MPFTLNPFTGNFDYYQSLTCPVTLTEVVGSSALTITGATQTASFPALSITQTWNNAGVTFTGALINVTKTAASAASLLLSVQLGGALRFSVREDGLVTSQNSIVSGFSLQAAAAATIGWSDTVLYRDGAANIIAQRNSTNAQTFRLYNTYTDASNYERGYLTWSSNTFTIGAEKAGTGTARSFKLASADGTPRMTIPPAFTQGLSLYAGGTRTSASASDYVVNVGGGSSVGATSGTYWTFDVNENFVTSSTSTAVFVPVQIRPTINYSNATPGAGSYEALKIAVTETALPTGTNYLIRASAGAAGTTDMFRVRNDGRVLIQSGISIYHVAGQGWFGGAGEFGILDTTFNFGTSGLILAKDANDTFAQRRGTNAQTFNIYNTYTDASNYERMGIGFSSNIAVLDITKAGTGSQRAFEMRATGTAIFSVSTTGGGTFAAGLSIGAGNTFSAGNFATSTSTTENITNGWSLRSASVRFGSATYAGWSSGAANSALDTAFYRNAAGVVEINNGTAGTYRDLKLRAIELVDGNAVLGTTTGTKFGTATTQKLGFWNATPIVQPDTAVAAATFTANAGTAVNDASTFDGYTLNQIVKALRNTGLLA